MAYTTVHLVALSRTCNLGVNKHLVIVSKVGSCCPSLGDDGKHAHMHFRKSRTLILAK